MELNETLKLLRKNKGLTQQECADDLGINLSSYQKYERSTNTVTPSIEALIKIADYYDVSLDYLLGREPKADPYLDLNLKKADEDEMLKKYMSLPENVRAMLLKVMKELVGEDENDSDPEHMTDAKGRVRHTALAGDILDEWERQRKANEKDVG